MSSVPGGETRAEKIRPYDKLHYRQVRGRYVPRCIRRMVADADKLAARTEHRRVLLAMSGPSPSPDPGQREREIETAHEKLVRRGCLVARGDAEAAIDTLDAERVLIAPDPDVSGVDDYEGHEGAQKILDAERARTPETCGTCGGEQDDPQMSSPEAALKRIAEGPDTAIIKAQIAEQALDAFRVPPNLSHPENHDG